MLLCGAVSEYRVQCHGGDSLLYSRISGGKGGYHLCFHGLLWIHGAGAGLLFDALIYKVPNCNEVLVVGTDLTKVPFISEYTESTRNIVDQKSREHE